MNNNIESQLGQYSFKKNGNKDLKVAVDLSLSHKELEEFDIVRVLSIDDQFNKERASSPKYRFHGSISSISPITGRKLIWDSFDDMFDEGNKAGFGNLADYFDFYLCYPSSMTPLTEGGDLYVRNAKVISKLDEINLLDCGFAVSAFNEKIWNFVFNESYNIGELKTEYNHRLVGEDTTYDTLPVTEVFILAHPKMGFTSKQFNAAYQETELFSSESVYGFNERDITNELETLIKDSIIAHIKPTGFTEHSEEIKFEDIVYPVIIFLFKMLDLNISAHNVQVNKTQIKKYLGFGVTSNYSTVNGVNTVEIGDTIMCDLVKFNKQTFSITKIDTQEYFFTKRLTLPDTTDTKSALTGSTIIYSANTYSGVLVDFSYKLNPFLEIKIRDYSNYVEVGNPAVMDSIPEYATTNSDNEKVWRDLLSIGYTELESGRGVDYPFVNGCHYIYSNLQLQIKPDMDANNSYKTYRSYFMGNEITHYSNNINKF
jgi:hypothetical protein